MTDSEKLDLIFSEMQGIKTEVQGIKTNVQSLTQRTTNIETSIQDIKLILENELRVNIQKLDNEKEMLAIRVNVLETELRRVKEQINQIA